MTLIDRITRLFRADLHDLLDKIEEPPVVLRQAVRDMDEELARDEHRLRQLEGEVENLAVRLTELEISRKEIEVRLEVCFQSGREDLARQLIKRRLEIDSLDKQLCRKKSQLEDSRLKHKARFQDRQTCLQEIRQKAEVLADQAADEAFVTDPGLSSAAVIRDEDVEVAFLMEKQSRSRS